MTMIEMIRTATGSELIAKVGRFEVYRLLTPLALGRRVECKYALCQGSNVTMLSFAEVAQLAEVLPKLVDAGVITAEVPRQTWDDAVQAQKDAAPRRPVLFC